MSRRTRKPASASRRATAPPAVTARRRTARVWTLLFLLGGPGVLALAGYWGWRATHRAGPTAFAADPVATMDPRAAHARALALHREGRNHESLRFYRRALTAPGGPNDATVHFDYANALYNSVFELDTLQGRGLAVVPTSVERVALMREALELYTRAAAISSTPAQRARCYHELARTLQVWGLEWEALLAHQKASELDPGNAAYAEEADAFLMAMREPQLARAAGPEAFDAK